MKKKVLILIVGILIPVILAGLFWRQKNSSENKQKTDSQKQAEIILADAINGSKVSPEIATARPIAVMVENHPDARPQSGLSDADVVYEALAEGGITRFLTIFQTQNPVFIGPVRSAREYYAQIADQWGALYAHVGGSNEVIAQLKSGQYKNLDDANEYYNFDFFPRRNSKPQPHHIFTTVEKLRELISFHKYQTKAKFVPWNFKDDSPVASSTATKISIDFSRAGYEVGWVYDSKTNSYGRLQYFEPHVDENTGKQIFAKTVVVQMVKVTPVPKDPLLSVDIDLKSGGKAYVFLDGQVIEGVWKNEPGKTRFYDNYNQEISFNRGPIWVELVPVEKEVSWK